MPINPTTLKALIDTQITNETVDFAITPAEVGGRMKDTIDYTSEQIVLKENLTNKSTNVTTDGASDTKYPSVKAVKDYVDENAGGNLPYGIISFFLSIADATPSFVIKQNDFPDSIITMTNPSNGKIRITTTENVFNSSTKLMATIFNVGGQMFFGVPNYNLLAFPTWFLDIDLKRFDNTQTGTPTINNIYFEIRIFNE